MFVALTVTCSDTNFFMLIFLFYIYYYAVGYLFSNTSLLFNILLVYVFFKNIHLGLLLNLKLINVLCLYKCNSCML